MHAVLGNVVRYQSMIRGLLAFGAVLLATAALLTTLLSAPAGITIDVGVPGDAFFVSNWYAAEQSEASFRWSAPSARLIVPNSADAPLLTLRLHSNQYAPKQDWWLKLHGAGRTSLAFGTSPAWRVYHVLLPPASPPSAASMFAFDLASPTVRASPGDPRTLGVALDWVHMERTRLWSGVPLRRALALIWGVGLLAWALWTLDGPLWGASRAASRTTRTLGLTIAAAAGVTLWAWIAPNSLAWALPTESRRLALGTVILALGTLLASQSRRIQSLISIRARIGWGWRAFAGLALLHLLISPPLPLALRGVAALSLLALPGVLAALALFRAERDPLLQLFLGLCGGLALPPLLLLALQALPGALPSWLLLLATDLLTLALLWWLARQPPHSPALEQPCHPYPLLVLALLLGAALRLPGLGRAEFQGDESRAMLLAAGLPHGQDNVLLAHTKGPIEVLAPAGPLVLLGQTNELIARLPFALSGLGILLGVYLLAWHMLGAPANPRRGAWVGLLAIAILATEGFLVGFARIVQYQSIILLMALGALWCGWRFYEGVDQPGRYLGGAALLTAVGLLGHYDALAGVPALLWLVLAGGWQRGWRAAQWARQLAIPVLIGTALVASFYVPFVRSELFSQTAAYLSGRTRQGGLFAAFFNNLPAYYQIVSFYNPAFQIQGLGVTLALGVVAWLCAYVRPPTLGWGLAVLLLGGCLVLAAAPPRFGRSQEANWAILVFGLPLAGLTLSRTIPPGLRTLLLWFSTAFIGESFLIADPRTHFYTMHPSAALLIALIISQLLDQLQRPGLGWLRLSLGLAGGGLLALATLYGHLIFVRQFPEYYRVFPAARPALYQASYGNTLPKGGYFGFQHQDGWKVIGALYRSGLLSGTYDSNQKTIVTGWYTGQIFQCDRRPAYYFQALGEPANPVPQGYQLFGYVTIGSLRTLDIYSRAPAAQAPAVFALEDYASSFDTQPVANTPLSYMLGVAIPQQRLEATWQGGIRLRGYDLDQAQARPGAQTSLSLYWQVEGAVAGHVVPVVELLDHAGGVVAEATPFCGTVAADAPGGTVRGAPFTIALAPYLPAGTYRLRVGLRDAQHAQWLPLADGAEQLTFATLVIAP